ncbi:DNA primase [Cellulomonas sp. zg-ZUI222]|uniref:DNA primase n=1 Tax=Cellulomonas wangleii TaxID=2816956 RepID=A0ABX8D0T8_9CELL|nr:MULTISPECIES: DNA primase [Cellulomonas]MBO0900029.1 DNA primase [Cellulomonas sp. zg-ZUI22]MBO0921056.1 DNA primase [Cellulomonas wangleii]MBO0925462.1 DNA primase [Cellulomonas wangleii]QVI61065.1 DNA primase [Cellulomonas wangleii]
MAGRILREDVEAVRERVHIEEVVGAHVALRPAGVGSLKGLCPFHDERSPSFHVRPQVGRYHCFGCGEGGDVIAFVQKVDGLGFTDAVEYLASRAGMQLRYEEGGGPSRPGEEPGRRRRLLDAHRIAEEFYREQLVQPQAAAARAFLAERGFDRSAADDFGVGFAPQGWDALLRHLRGRGFTEAELTASGLVSQGQRGIYDRFRGRLVWPIREVTGETVGFGARRLFDEDNGPKYLNTPETPLYRKSHVLYGIDLAKREIAREKQVVVVEGYTDVMAMHLSGVRTAVATCGTAFGPDHARIVRRLVGDSGGAAGVQLAGGSSVGGEIVFTFDGDAAGQKAALRAFGEDQALTAQTFVAVEPSGMDPCDLRQARGPDAVRALVSSRQPLFEFVIRSTLAAHDLRTAEGRVAALRATAPVVAGIRDSALRPEYERLLAGWLGMDDVTGVRRAVADAARRGPRPGARPTERDAGRRSGEAGPTPVPVARMAAPDRRDPVAQVERTALEVVLQHPTLVPPEFDQLAPDACTAPAYRAVHEAVRAAGGVAAAQGVVAAGGGTAWVGAVIDEAAEPVHALLTELSVAPLPEDRPDALPAYVRGVVLRLVDIGITRRIADVRGRLQRLGADADPAEQRALLGELMELEAQRRSLRSA